MVLTCKYPCVMDRLPSISYQTRAEISAAGPQFVKALEEYMDNLAPPTSVPGLSMAPSYTQSGSSHMFIALTFDMASQGCNDLSWSFHHYSGHNIECLSGKAELAFSCWFSTDARQGAVGQPLLVPCLKVCAPIDVEVQLGKIASAEYIGWCYNEF